MKKAKILVLIGLLFGVFTIAIPRISVYSGHLSLFLNLLEGEGLTELVSVSSKGVGGNLGSYSADISADGRYVVFQSEASNLVNGDTNGQTDIFVHDRQTDQTTRVSVASNGAEANDSSLWATISGDGRFVTFSSYASNLVAGDTNNTSDIFVHDRVTSITTRVSVNNFGAEGNNLSTFSWISATGRYVVFSSFANNLVVNDTNNQRDIFVHDRQTVQTIRASIASDGTEGNGESLFPSISADGRYAVFHSKATNLVPTDTNNREDIFIHDQQTGQTTRVSVASNGTQGNGDSRFGVISADNLYVAFHSLATNLVNGDTNGVPDVFIHEIQTGQTSRISIASDGTQANGTSFEPALSGDGRYVGYYSFATNLISNDVNNNIDVFIYDRLTGGVNRVSVASDGTPGNGQSTEQAVSADGRYVTFHSLATNLVANDTNGYFDVFVHDRGNLNARIETNYPTGAPGSYFTLTGHNFLPNDTTTIFINGSIVGNLAVDGNGEFTFLLTTSNADEGTYIISVNGVLSSVTTLTLDTNAPIRPQEGNGPVFDVPPGIAFTESTFMPFVSR